MLITGRLADSPMRVGFSWFSQWWVEFSPIGSLLRFFLDGLSAELWEFVGDFYGVDPVIGGVVALSLGILSLFLKLREDGGPQPKVV